MREVSRLKEYKILTADSLEQAEQVMNDMAQVGWRVVGTTVWSPWGGHQFVITLERDAR